jgi:nucleotide-binding universal stress UspA family protein
LDRLTLMPFQEILVVQREGQNNEAVLSVTVQLAASFGAHVKGLCIYAPPNPSVAECFAIGNRAEDSVLRHLDERKTKLIAPLKEFNNHLAQHGVAGTWKCLAQSDIVYQATTWARLADLVVLHQPGPGERLPLKLAESLLRGGAPCLLIPRITNQPAQFSRVVIAWDGSPEARHALDLALPFLHEAKAILVVTVARSAVADERDGPDALQSIFSHNQIHAEVQRLEHDGHISDQILMRCKSFGADLLVLGAFGRSPRTEAIFGGVTREILLNSQLPALLLH